MALQQQMVAIQQEAGVRAELAQKEAEKTRNDYEAQLAEKERLIAELSGTVDRVQRAASKAASAVDTEALDACRRRVKEYTALLSDGAAVVRQCTAELRGKDTALKACVKAYEGLEIAYDSDK